MTHKLKTWPCYFERVVNDDKRFEIRDDSDRGFQKGDKIILQEYDPERLTIESKKYTGREIEAIITFVTSFKQKDGYVVFNFKTTQHNI